MNRRLMAILVLGTVVTLMLALAGTASAQVDNPGGGGGNAPPPGEGGGEPNPSPPPGGGAAGGGGFIAFGAGFPYGTTTVDFSAFPVGGFGGGFSISAQPTVVTVSTPVPTSATGGFIDSTFLQAGL